MKHENRHRELSDSFKHNNIQIIGILGEEEKEGGGGGGGGGGEGEGEEEEGRKDGRKFI